MRLVEQIGRQRIDHGMPLPRPLNAPFIDVVEYLTMGLTPRQAAECFLSLAVRRTPAEVEAIRIRKKKLAAAPTL
jgi:hypothetical protein